MDKETKLKKAYDYHYSMAEAYLEAPAERKPNLEAEMNKVWARLTELGITPDEYADYIKQRENPKHNG